MSGLGVWLWARPSVHVGISGIVHGLMFFLFVMGLLRRDRLGVAIALLVFFLYGGMVMTVLPREQEVSFEYHLFGAIAGVIVALGTFRLDPKPQPKRYTWEDEEESAEPIDQEYDFDEALRRDESRAIPLPTRPNDKPTVH